MPTTKLSKLGSLESGNEAKEGQETTTNAELAGGTGVGGSRRGRRGAVAGGGGSPGCIAGWVWRRGGDRGDRGGPHGAAVRGGDGRDGGRLRAPALRGPDAGTLSDGRC